MSRDVVLATMVLVLCGAGVLLSAWLSPAVDARQDIWASGRTLERRAWLRLWLPLLPAAIVLATLCGWALQEPAVTDELLRPIVVVVAVPLGLLWLRGLARASSALRRPRALPPVATLGILRPRVVIAEEVGQALDAEALAAASAHERAHARHFDPLRLWLAQLATDLQWPSPTARQRLVRWRAALELARDEEARAGGTSGEALAAAIVTVAGMVSRPTASALARLTGAEASLRSRVQRLLDPLPLPLPLPLERRARGLAWLSLLAAVLVAAFAVGTEYGDSLLRALPFIRS